MQRVLIKCGWLVTLDPAIGDFKGADRDPATFEGGLRRLVAALKR